MPTALLRYCACSILFLAFALDSASQKQHVKRRELKINVDTAVVRESQKENPPTQERFSRENLIRALRELNNANYARADTGTKWIICENRPLAIEDFVDVELKLDDLNYSEPPITEIAPDFTITNDINKPKVADAYPFISGDGLRLYFTSNREEGVDKLFISTRKTIADPFVEPKILIPGIADYFGVSLTADELTLCTAKKGEVYISMRANKDQEFPKPQKIEGTKSDYHFGPAISPDGKKIIVIEKVDGKDAISVYGRTAPYKVKYITTETFLDGNDPGPGQFSKDGLSYYFSIEKDNEEHLWRYTGGSPGDFHSKLEDLHMRVKGEKNLLQPSLNDDGSILVFVTSSGGWDGDEIRLVNLSPNNFIYPEIADSIKNEAGNTTTMIHSHVQPMTIEYSTNLKQDMSAVEKPVAINLMESPVITSKAYPNPFTTSVNIELPQVPAHGAVFSLYDASGKVVREQKISSSLTNVQLGKLPSGSYVYRIVDDKGKLISSGNLLKVQ